MRLFYVAALLLVSMSVNAANYSWNAVGYSNGFSDPEAACKFVKERDSINIGANGPVLTSLTRKSDVEFDCFSYTESGYIERHVVVGRSGDTCADPAAVYNGQTGKCEVQEPPEDPCKSREGATQHFSKSGTMPDAYMNVGTGGRASLATRNGCFDGCAAEVIDNRCKYGVAGSYLCRGTMLFSGTSCVNATEPSLGEAAGGVETPELETQTEQTPCNYITKPDGSQSCVSVDSQANDGRSCGTFNGVQICTDKNPDKNETKVDTTVTPPVTNPDGTKSTTKTDVATVTKCTGVGVCTTTTTTTKTTTKTDGTGKTTSTTTVCTGAKCSSGSGTGGGGGGGGEGESFEGPELDDDVPGFGDALGDFMDAVSGSPIVSAASGISMPGGGSCSFASASTKIGEINANAVCQNASWLDPLYPVMLAMWALAAVRIFLSA
ncbi:hypothetical protein [Pseudomonas sp. UBA6310]|uniref:hypothetical protein n=1 Tax=Pseudomonas sp. UBA6310 TaxID=1947327 RepID=UPI002580DE09|nr:hypothetical protein [Pseudomonas sp. UBA6310]